MTDGHLIWHAYKDKVKPAVTKKLKTKHAKSAGSKSLKAVALQEAGEVRRALASQKIKSPIIESLSDLTSDVHRPLERKREKAIRGGELAIDAKLDLHGMTQVEAFEALTHFMHKKVKAGKRHLLIITGKGRGGEGVLRSSLQGWLGQLPEAKAVIALRQASLKHGGEGAFYVILRKKPDARA